MPWQETTVGRWLVSQALPEDLRREDRVLDKAGLASLLEEVARKHPDRYREISHRLNQIGQDAAYTSGSFSFGLRHLLPSRAALAARTRLNARLQKILDDDSLSDDDVDAQVLSSTHEETKDQEAQTYAESLEEENPLALQVRSGARGNPLNLATLRAGDVFYSDHRNRVIPIPVLHSYSEGLTPSEYFAGAFGTRQGVHGVKFMTAKAGFLGKLLGQVSHRAVVEDLDEPDDPDRPLRGLPVDSEDADSEGSLLAQAVGGYDRNTVVTPKVLQALRQQGIKRFLVRSPAVTRTPEGGVYARDAGVREFGDLPSRGTNVGMVAAQSLSEPLASGMLATKHSGGIASVVGPSRAFRYVDQLVNTTQNMLDGAAHAEVDGLVQRIEPAPAGGQNVWIENQKHYVADGYPLKIQKGQRVEAGDVISEGIPNPSKIVEHKGIGAGKQYFMQAFRDTLKKSRIRAHRRNIELLAGGLINHVRLTKELGDFNPDDVVPYSLLESQYRPRPGYESRRPQEALNRYLERPYLHYSIGTKIRPSMLADFAEFGVDRVDVHEEEPPFQPEMLRGMVNLQHDPDWITRMFGSGLQTGLLKATHYGAVSNPKGTSFVPALAQGTGFGQQGKIQVPKPVGIQAAAGKPEEKQAQEVSNTAALLSSAARGGTNAESEEHWWSPPTHQWDVPYTGGLLSIPTDSQGNTKWPYAVPQNVLPWVGGWYGPIASILMGKGLAAADPQTLDAWLKYRRRQFTNEAGEVTLPSVGAGLLSQAEEMNPWHPIFGSRMNRMRGITPANLDLPNYTSTSEPQQEAPPAGDTGAGQAALSMTGDAGALQTSMLPAGGGGAAAPLPEQEPAAVPALAPPAPAPEMAPPAPFQMDRWIRSNPGLVSAGLRALGPLGPIGYGLLLAPPAARAVMFGRGTMAPSRPAMQPAAPSPPRGQFPRLGQGSPSGGLLAAKFQRPVVSNVRPSLPGSSG